MKIKDVSKACGLSEKSIRYYEDMELLQVERKSNGYREYHVEDMRRLQEIALFRSLNASIEDMKQYYLGQSTLDQFLSNLLVKQQKAIHANKEAIAFTKRMQAHHDEHDFSLLKEFEKRKGIRNEVDEIAEIEYMYLAKGKQGKRNLLLLMVGMLAIAFLWQTNFDTELIMGTLVVTFAMMILILLFPITYEYFFLCIKMIFKWDVLLAYCEKKWISMFPNAYVRWGMKFLFVIFLMLIIIIFANTLSKQ